ncbi:MAG: hypothetical protein WDN27_00145 [Candidatus Saccharibacteria bacterium]
MRDDHVARVSKIAAEVRRFYRAGKPFRIFHGSTNSTRILSFKRSETIDVSNLKHGAFRAMQGRAKLRIRD